MYRESTEVGDFVWTVSPVCISDVEGPFNIIIDCFSFIVIMLISF